MKIVIVGGHLTPAFSVMEELPKDVEVLYIGRRFALEGDKALSLEYETISKKGIRFAELKTGRLQRNLSRHTLPSLAKIPYGLAQSGALLMQFKPDVVVGFGGYVSMPVLLAAKVLKIPTVIHEQTLEAGASNRALSKLVNKVCISFETSRKYFPKDKVVFTGNPIRRAILSPSKKFPLETSHPVVFVTGGSLGSHVINLTIEKILSKLVDKYTLIHQTGASTQFKDFEKLTILKEGLNNDKRKKYVLKRHFSPEEIGEVLRISDLVVARSGINTVSELIVLEKPSLLIPLPFSQKNEQMKNAQLLKKYGLAEIVEQNDLTPETFQLEIAKMIDHIEAYKLNSGKSDFPKNAAKKIVEVIYAAAKNNN